MPMKWCTASALHKSSEGLLTTAWMGPQCHTRQTGLGTFGTLQHENLWEVYLILVCIPVFFGGTQIPLTCASTRWGYDMLIRRCPLKNPLSHGWLEPTVNPRQEQLSWALVPPQTKRGGKNTWEFRVIYLYPLLTPKQQLNPQRFLEYERNCWPRQRGDLSFRKTG